MYRQQQKHNAPINIRVLARLLVLEMARLLHQISLVATPAIISLLLLLAALAPAAATAAGKKVGMRFRQASKEEAEWLDRYAETHQPLGAGPLRMVRATTEEEHWLNRFSEVGESHDDGEDDGGSGSNINFDDDNPYVEALRAWVSRLTKQSMEKAQAENPFQDL